MVIVGEKFPGKSFGQEGEGVRGGVIKSRNLLPGRHIAEKFNRQKIHEQAEKAHWDSARWRIT